jgi:putative peptidoglycan lipid II flippase
MALPLISQSNILLERVVSSWIGVSLIPALGYARFISETALTLTAIPLGILALSVHGGSKSREAVESVQAITSRLCLLAFPLSAFVTLNSFEIVDVVFNRGAFTARDVEMTSIILSGLGIGLAPLIVSYYLIKALTAQMRNAAALLTTIAGVGVSMGFNLLFWRTLGPLALGLAGAMYGIAMFFITFSLMKQWTTQVGILACLVLGCLIQFVLQKLIPTPTSTLLCLLQASILWAALWITLCCLLRPLRATVSPVFRQVLNRLYIQAQ